MVVVGEDVVVLGMAVVGVVVVGVGVVVVVDTILLVTWYDSKI